MKKKIIILGAGFGGMYTYMHLRPFIDQHNLAITIVDRDNHFLFTPLLHEVATGSLNQHHVVESIRKYLYTCPSDFLQAEVQSIDMEKKIVHTSRRDVVYDYAVIALGAETNHFRTPGSEHTFGLKTLYDAVQLRNACIDAFEHASTLPSSAERKKLLSFAIVGGGPTGVELVAEMAEFCYGTLSKYYAHAFSPKEIQITLINRGSSLLSQFPTSLRDKALHKLREKGVNVKLNSPVCAVTEHGVEIEGGSMIAAQHVVWVAGVRSQIPSTLPSPTITKDSRIMVDDTLVVPGYPHMFVVGDMAGAEGQWGERCHPMLAQVAVQQAKTVAQNIIRTIQRERLKPFTFSANGYLISVGRWMAVGTIGPLQVSGPLVWLLWHVVYWTKFLSWSQRLRIAMDWVVNVFSPRDITKIEHSISPSHA